MFRNSKQSLDQQLTFVCPRADVSHSLPIGQLHHITSYACGSTARHVSTRPYVLLVNFVIVLCQWIVKIDDIMVKKKFRAIYVAGWHEWNVVPFVLSMCLSRCLAYLQALSMLHDDHIMVN